MEKTCYYCGKPIPATRRSNAIYCSENCQRNASAHKIIDRIKSRAKKISLVAHAVYLAYGSKCAICQWQATPELIAVKGAFQHAHGNEIHHIIPISEGGTEAPDNIILLCPNHHKQADLGILTREALKAYTKPYELTPEDIDKMKKNCADRLAKILFNVF